MRGRRSRLPPWPPSEETKSWQQRDTSAGTAPLNGDTRRAMIPAAPAVATPRRRTKRPTDVATPNAEATRPFGGASDT